MSGIGAIPGRPDRETQGELETDMTSVSDINAPYGAARDTRTAGRCAALQACAPLSLDLLLLIRP